MARIDNHIVAERKDLFPHVTEEALVITSGKIGSANGTRKKGISNKNYPVRHQ
jgi:hypothetical protein